MAWHLGAYRTTFCNLDLALPVQTFREGIMEDPSQKAWRSEDDFARNMQEPYLRG